MDKNESSEEQPKQVVAKKVITQKRLYFVPDHAISVEAEGPSEAIELAKNKDVKKRKDGDG